MAVYSINTSAKRDAALSAIVTRINARRTAWNAAHPTDPPKAAITNDQYLQKRVNEVLDSYVDQEDRRTEITNMTPGRKALLGLRDPEDDPNDLGGLP